MTPSHPSRDQAAPSELARATARGPPARPGARCEEDDATLDVEEAVDVLLRDLRSSREGLSSTEAQRRARQYGPNELKRHEGVNWPKEVWKQFTEPVALLLWVAAALEFVIGQSTIGTAIVLVILINAVMALAEERQAERSVEALSSYLPERTEALRDGHLVTIEAADLVPGDVILVEEGERVPADIRLIDGSVELDRNPPNLNATPWHAPSLLSRAALAIRPSP